MSTIMGERVETYTCDGSKYYVISRQSSNDENNKKIFEILDSDLNRLAMQLGINYKKVAEARLREFKKDGRDVFLGKSSPISVICDSVFINTNSNEMRAIWEKPTREQLIHYRSLIGLPYERMIEVENEGNIFYAYYDGTTFYDEDAFGKKIKNEKTIILDNCFNKHDRDVPRERAKAIQKNLLMEGKPAILGPHSPVKLVFDPIDKREVYVLNTDETTVGIWIASDPKEERKYQELLDIQKKRRGLCLNLTPTDNK